MLFKPEKFSSKHCVILRHKINFMLLEKKKTIPIVLLVVKSVFGACYAA